MRPREWPKLLGALGAEALQGDPRFADGDARRADSEGLYQALATYFRLLTLEEAQAVLTEAGILRPF